VLVAVLQREQNKKLNRIEGLSSVTKEQVANSHGTNLRDDLDRLHGDVRGIRLQQNRTDLKLDAVAAKHELTAIQAQVEHSRLWDAITGGEPPMPETSETEIIQLAEQKKQGDH
jgi:hypothetical protein